MILLYSNKWSNICSFLLNRKYLVKIKHIDKFIKLPFNHYMQRLYIYSFLCVVYHCRFMYQYLVVSSFLIWSTVFWFHILYAFRTEYITFNFNSNITSNFYSLFVENEWSIIFTKLICVRVVFNLHKCVS